MSPVLLLLYFASGVGVLAVETVWMRWLRLLLGATAPAASATLIAFFTGHAMGAWWAGRRSPGWRRPLGVYGRLELTAAAAALAVPLGLAVGDAAVSALYDGLRSWPAGLGALRFAVALGATLPAAFCFGATFPAIGTAAVGPAGRLGVRGSLLYGLNTLGAALGTALAVFVLPGWIGVRATYGLAVGLLGSVGLAALWIDAGRRAVATSVPAQSSSVSSGGTPARREQRRRARSERPSRRGARRTPEIGARGLLALAALSGFGALALQVLLVQSFGQVLNQSIYAFGAVLVTVLGCVAAGAAAVACLAGVLRLDPRTGVGFALATTALAVLAFPAWLERGTGGLGYVGSEAGSSAYLVASLVTALVTAGPALLSGSLVLPLCFVLAARRAERGQDGGVGAILGRLVAANTLGAIAGALAAPYWLMPGFGLWGAFVVLSIVYGVAAVAVPESSLRRRFWRVGLLAIGWMAILTRASPLAISPAGVGPEERLLHVETTPAAVVSVAERDGQRLIRVDSHYALGGTAEQAHQERQAHLPLVLAPHARKVVYVGSATGISAGAVLAHPIDRLHVVEIAPGVARAAARFFASANRGVYQSPRAEVVLDDARNFLANTRQRFDLVVADLFVPWRAGTGSLYTREHFESIRERLTPNGAFCQWLPLYQLSREEWEVVAATFLDVFPRSAVFRGDFYGRFPIAALVGWVADPAPPQEVNAAARRLNAAGEQDRWVSDPDGVWALYVAPLAPFRESLASVPRNLDDRPWVEVAAARGHAGGELGKLDPLVGMVWVRLSERLRAAAEATGDALYPDLGEPERRASRGGAMLQLAGALWSEGRAESAAEAFARAAELLPTRLVANAPADPTAADLWGN